MNIDAVKERAKDYISKTAKKVIPLPSYITRWNGMSKPYYEGLYEMDKEIVLRTLNQKEFNNVLLVGSSIKLRDFSNKLWQDLKDGKYDNKDFDGYEIFILDVQKFYLPKTGDLYKAMKRLSEKLKVYDKVILYIDDFKRFFEAGILNILTPFLYENVRIIAGIDEVDWDPEYLQEKFIMNYFGMCIMSNLERKDFKKYIMPSIRELEEHHGLKYSPEAIDKCILISNAFEHDNFLEVASDNFDYIASTAKEKGHKIATVDDVMEVITPQLKLLNKITDENKFRTAIHEAGHYTVFHEMKNLPSLKIETLTIIPTANTLGFISYDMDVYNTNHDMKYVEDSIAFGLGGWAAEKVFFELPSIGSAGDIQSVVQTAYSSIAYGVMDETVNNASTIVAIISNDSGMSTNKDKSIVNNKMNEVIATQSKRAIDIITEHKDFVEALANALLKHAILSAQDIQRIVDQYY